MQNIKQIESELNAVVNELEDPIEFLTFDQEKSNRLNKGVKLFYDFMKKTEDPSDNNSDSLPELIIKDLDHEQIYQQLQLHDSANFNSMVKFFSKCLANPDNVSFNIKTSKNDKKKDDRIKNLEKRRQKLRDEESTDDEEDFQLNGKNDDDVDGAIVDGKLSETNGQKANGKKETVFGIPDGSDSEISDFEVDETNGQDDDDDEDEEDDDLQGDDDGFGGLEDDDEDEDDDDEENEDDEDRQKSLLKKLKDKKLKNGVENVDDLDSDEVDEDLEDMYGDLGDEKKVLELGKPAKEFNNEDFEEELNDHQNNIEEKNSDRKNEKKKVAFKDLFENNDNDNEDDIDENGEKKSSHQKRQEKFKEKIDQIHDSMIDNLQNKPWQLKGEATAKARPQDSLLEEFLQFDHTTRQAPTITPELNMKLEDIIKQRIKDKAFDDVERKLKPVEMNYEYKKQVALDHEKSKLSLSQVYEQEYLNKTAELTSNLNGVGGGEKEEVKNPKHDEIKKALESLFIKLDSLSNFHYTPRAPQPELKVVSNMPTISVEEVAPVNVSDATLLAPEEIHKNIDALPMSKDEEGKKDKSRKLRQKKIVAKKNKVKKEKALKIKQAANPDDAKLNKEVALEKLKKQSKNMSNNLKVLKKDKKAKVDSSLKSSSAFFKELNDTNINNKSKGKKNKKPEKEEQKSSKRLKL